MHSLLISERNQQQIRIDPRPRATLIDRLAMRIGLWLLIWGTRNPDDDREANRLYLEREAREREWVKLQQLHRPY